MSTETTATASEETTTMTATDHRPLILLVGGQDCLDRDCEEYLTPDGDDDPGVERCSHIHEETVCAACSEPPMGADGIYETTEAWPCAYASAQPDGREPDCTCGSDDSTHDSGCATAARWARSAGGAA